MRSLLALLVCAVVASGYGYWDATGVGGRVESLSPFSAGLCGAGVPDVSSALSLFTNPSATAGSDKIQISLTGWGTGWREEITYHYTCVEPSRFNIGAMSPRGAFAITIPVVDGFTVGAGIATVSQFQMKATAQVYREVSYNHRELWKTMVTDATGDIQEALVSFSHTVGPVNLGFSPGIRFGSGESVTYSNRFTGSSAYDSIYIDSWSTSGFAFRAGASMTTGYTTLFSTYISGDERYLSFAGVGAAASFPFMKGGYLGTELAVLDGDNLKMTAFASLPGIAPNSNMLLGVCGYRPDAALKAGIGLSIGGDYTMGDYSVSASYQYQDRYREGVAVPTSYINHLYDSSETVMVGIETVF